MNSPMKFHLDMNDIRDACFLWVGTKYGLSKEVRHQYGAKLRLNDGVAEIVVTVTPVAEPPK